jgi:glutaredoxin 2
MALPLQKRKNSFSLLLSHKLYQPMFIDKSLQDFSKKVAKKARTKNKEYTNIKFNVTDLNSVLEFSNYLLSLNR